MTIWPDAPARAAEFAVFHDSGELGAGDIPYPYKARHPALKEIISALEEESLSDQGIRPQWVDDVWRWRIKTADLIEMLEKGMEETLMGNKFGIPVALAMDREIMARVRGHADEPEVTKYLLDRWARYRAAKGMEL